MDLKKLSDDSFNFTLQYIAECTFDDEHGSLTNDGEKSTEYVKRVGQNELLEVLYDYGYILQKELKGIEINELHWKDQRVIHPIAIWIRIYLALGFSTDEMTRLVQSHPVIMKIYKHWF